MHEELIDIYNENMDLVGQRRKKDAHKYGFWHKSIHCWLFCEEGDKKYVIVQRRASSKLLMPNYYDVSVAGHYELGESGEDGLRELKEEFGISVPKESWRYLGIKFDVGMSANVVNKEFCEVYFAKTNVDLRSFKINPIEVAAVVKVEVKEGLRLFGGEQNEILATGIVWNEETNSTEEATIKLTKAEFIPRIDNYYSKIFAIADLYFKDYPYLYI